MEILQTVKEKYKFFKKNLNSGMNPEILVAA